MPDAETSNALELFECQLYLTNMKIKEVKMQGGGYLVKKQAQAESLSPTRNALFQAIFKEHTTNP